VTDLPPNSAPKRVCVLRLSAIGDTCHALAVIRRLQDNWPNAEITWIIGKTEAALMADIPDIQFIIFDKSRGRHAYRNVADKLRGLTFDVALCMHASMRANLLCRHIDAEIRLGFDRARARDLQWLFTNRRVDATPDEHVLLAMMSFAASIGAEAKAIRWEIPLGDDALRFAAGFRSPATPLIVISPCSSQRSRNYRNWRVENYAAVIRHLEDRGCRVLLTGGTSRLERVYGDTLSATSAAHDLIGRTSLKELLALINEADLLICPDSGPAHMATTVNTPVLGLYATSNPDRTGPFASRDLSVNRYPDAVQKYLGKSVDALRWGQRVRHPDAMGLISVADVTSRIDDFFST